MDIIRDGSGRIIHMGTQVTSADGSTTIRILNGTPIECRFEIVGAQIRLTFEDYYMADTIIRAAVNEDLLGLELQPTFVSK